MGVDLGRGNIHVAKHHLDRTEICPSLQKMAGKGVAEKMGENSFSNACSPPIGFDIFPELLPAHPHAQAVDEKKGAPLPFGKFFN